MWESITSEAAPKAIAYMATLSYVGAVTAAALACRTPAAPAFLAVCARTARIAAFVGVAALIARGWVHASAVADGAPDRAILARVLVESRWGGRWQWQFAAAVAALAVALTRAVARGAWPGAAMTAVLWCAATPLLGHGAATVWQHATHALHLLVTGGWLGTVWVLALASRRGSGVRPDDLGTVVGRFSPLAVVCATGAAISGVVLAITYVGGLPDLVDSSYGRWLLVKLAVVALAGGCGGLNWRRSLSGRLPAPAILQVESGAALLAVAVTAVLSETEHPAL